MDVDEAYKVVHECGCYHFVIYILICIFGQVISVWHVLGITFLGGTPSHHCNIPDGALLNESIPLEDGEYSSCNVYENYTLLSNNTVPCIDGWVYDPPDEITIVTEWDLVCDKGAYVDISQAVFMTGLMFGSITFGQLSDIFGRRPVWFISLWTQLVVAVGVAFTQNYISFTVLRFFVGFIEQGVDITSYVMVTEMFTPRWRTYAGINLTIFWAIGIMILPLMAFYIRNWRYLQLAISLPAILSVPLVWLIPESVRWSVSKGKIKKAERILTKIGKHHGVDVPPNILSGPIELPTENGAHENDKVAVNGEKDAPGVWNDDFDVDTVQVKVSNSDNDGLACQTSEMKIEDKNANGLSNKLDNEEPNLKNSYNVTDLFRTPKIRKYTLVMIFVWFVNSLVYYGLSLNTGLLGGNKYLNFFLSGAVEIPAYIVSAAVVAVWGRRIPLCSFHILGGVACIITVFIPEETDSGTDLSWLILTVALIGKFGIAGSFAIVFLYSTELFPTVVRNLGVGVSSFSSRIGGILAPLTVYLSSKVNMFIFAVFGILSIIAGLLVLILPETKGRVQPQLIEDVEKKQSR
ncbi:organic cation transporter protein-like [Glandiceps talaboti]